MTTHLNSKSVLFHGLGDALHHALAQQLDGVKIATDTTHDQPLDLIICAGGAMPPRAGIASVRIARHARLGAILADIRRALDEPALAVLPFSLAGDMFYPAEKKLERAGGDDITLTERETTLLLYLARHAPHAVSRDAILRDVWRYQDGIDTHTLETHIYRLRQKIERDSTSPTTLVTAADGYVLTGIAAADDDAAD